MISRGVAERTGWKGNLLALSIGLVLSLGLAELVLRIHNPIPLPVRGKRVILAPHTELEQDSPAPGSPKLEPKILLKTNAVGLRGEDPPPPGADRLRLITVGGSTTHSRFITHEKSWPGLLEQRLQAVLPKVWLNNAGLDGNTTFGHRLLLEQVVLDLRPNVVLFLIGVNDVGLAAGNQYDDSTRKALRDRFIEHSELLSTLQVFWRTFRARSQGLSNTPVLDLQKEPRKDYDAAYEEELMRSLRQLLPGYEARVRALVEACERRGVVPVLITQPALWGDVVDPTLGIPLGNIEQPPASFGQPIPTNAKIRWDALEAYNEVTRKVAAERKVLLIDLAAKMPKDSALYFDWIHYSLAGSERVAEIVAAELGPYLLRTTGTATISGEPGR